jgi:hypothetical protein
MEGLGNLANLAGGFSQLGLSADMIGKFVPISIVFRPKSRRRFAQGSFGKSLEALVINMTR